MATVAYSSLLGLALPTQGDLTGQWGDEVNDYITKYLDASVAGGLSITADVTLTKTTGSALGATSSQYAILTCSPASVNIVVTAPAAYKIYVVNNTSASYTVTIRGAGPTTGVVLSALEKAVVAWNGTDFFKVATSATDGVSTFSAGSTGLTPSSATSGAVTLAGTLAVLNGGTGVTTSTGTTNVVLSNSPTLTTPTIAGATLSGTVSGGGNQINNVVIGTTTPLAGAFTTLTASTSITNSSLTSGRVTFASTAGLLADSANLTFSGTQLTVTGAVVGNQNSAGITAQFTNADTADGYGVSIAAGGTSATRYALVVREPAGTQDWFKISSVTGQVGNSIFAPGAPGSPVVATISTAGLAVTGTLSATGTLSGGTSGTAYSFSGSAPATSLTLDSSGNLGLGVTPSAWDSSVKALQVGSGAALHDAGSGNTILSSNLYYSSTGNRYIATDFATAYQQNNGIHYWYTAASGTAGNAITFTQAMALDASGIVTMNAYGAGAATFSSAGVISSVSDETWKIKDGVPVDTDAMLKKLEPGYWYYNDEKKETFGADRQLGFYAQNVNAAIGPEAAPEPEEGKPWGYYDRSVLAITVMSLQKALATIETLTARITALETA